jgi:death-on-curing protein
VKEPIWIELRDVLAIHERLLALNGGAEGVRDRGLLESALVPPRQVYVYGDNRDLADLSAALIVGVVGNHPFVDGNKRTGFLLGVLILESNGSEVIAKEEDATEAVLALAGGVIDEAWLSELVAGEPDGRNGRMAG